MYKGACYIPPLSHFYTVHVETVDWLLQKHTFDTDLLLYGDYNARFTFNDVGLLCNGRTSPRSDIMFDFFSSLNLYQLNDILNITDSQLNLVISNNPQVNVMSLDNSIVPFDQYHPVLTT